MVFVVASVVVTIVIVVISLASISVIVVLVIVSSLGWALTLFVTSLGPTIGFDVSKSVAVVALHVPFVAELLLCIYCEGFV